MPTRSFEGYGGTAIAARVFGQDDNPCVLLIPAGHRADGSWEDAAEALAAAGRFVVLLDLRGHGMSEEPADGRYDLDAHVRDLIAVLSQLSSRPAIVGAALGGWVALAALGEGGPDLASGLVLVDAPARIEGHRINEFDVQRSEAIDPAATADRLETAASALKLPTLIVRGAQSALASPQAIESLTRRIEGAEAVEIEAAGHRVASDQTDAFNAVLLEFLERRIPRDPPEYLAGSDSRTLRDALGCFATGVTVVTTLDEAGAPVGLTANSFTAISLDPELLLVSLARTASSLPAFEAAEHFAVNVLHIGQQPISNRFATKGEDKFADTDWEGWETGAPIIKGSLASFECARHAMHDGGDHVIMIGKVERVRFEPRRDPLLYFRGKYRRLHFA